MRRILLLSLVLAFCFASVPAGAAAGSDGGRSVGPEESFSIAVVADPQYADDDPKGEREPRQALNRLANAVRHWNGRDLDFAVMLGDVIDWDDVDYTTRPDFIPEESIDWKHADAVLKIWNTLDLANRYIVLGNHDWYVPDRGPDGAKPDRVLRKFGFSDKAYYDFRHKGYRFIVLDGNDFYYFAYPKGSSEYEAARAYYEAFSGPQKRWWNGAISIEQQAWLMDRLDESAAVNEPVVIMCHYPIHKPEDMHSLLNNSKMLSILDGYPNVVLWLSGHDHAGEYTMHGARHHLSIQGMMSYEDAWYRMDFSPRRIELYAAEETRIPRLLMVVMLPEYSLKAPEDLEAGAKDGAGVKLSWDQPPPLATGVVIERRNVHKAEVFRLVGETGPEKRGFVDETVVPGREYVYRIRFKGGEAGSGYSRAARTKLDP
jgi:hypothetical protein